MNSELIEKLHEQASSAYLQGDVEGALAAWRKVLEVDPGDERAQEGVALCERMNGCEAGSVVTSGQSPFAVGQARAPAARNDDGKDADVDDSVDQLLEMGAAPSPPRKPASSSPSPPASERKGGLLDLSDLKEEAGSGENAGGFDIDELLCEPGASDPLRGGGGAGRAPLPPPPSSEEAETTWHFGIGPEPTEEPESEGGEKMTFGSSETDPPGEASGFGAAEADALGARGATEASPPQKNAEEVAAASLHRRVSDLLAKALSEMEQGDRGQALETLDRLLILDGENEAARSLRRKLIADSGGSETVDGDERQASDRLQTDVQRDEEPEPSHEEGPLVPAPPEVLEGILQNSAPDPLPATAFDPVVPAAPATPEPFIEETATDEMPAVAGRGRLSMPPILASRKVWIPAALVVLLAAGFTLWSTLFGGGEEASAIDPAAPVVEKRKKPERDSPAPDPAAGPAVDPAETPTFEEQLAAAVGRADEALARADYAAAVVAFNEALRLDPENVELRARLEAAGESYRVQQAKRERWEQAINDFNNGDYSAALAYFYRLPEEEQNETVERYMRDGWYNLGVTALKSRQCDDARDHFGEARRIDAADEGVLAAADLAARCSREGVSGVWTSVNALRYRGLEDAP